MATRPKRALNKVNYVLLNELGMTGLDEKKFKNMVQTDMASQEELLDINALDDGEFELEDQNWDARKLAVSDARFSAQQQAFKDEMDKLTERELIIQREKEILDMKERMVARQQELQVMERELAARNAALSRFEHADRELSTDRVVTWLDSNQAGGIGAEWARASASTGAPRANAPGDPYSSAMALVNEDNLVTCTETGVSRLQSSHKLQRAPKSEPVLGERVRSSMGRPPYPTAVPLRPTPVIGQQDDGESIISCHTNFSCEAVKSESSENKKRVKSGMYDKIADDVVRKLKWPHKKLDSRWVSPRPLVHQLSFEHVVAGEIAIIMRSNNPEEVRCRLHILQKLAYWNLQAEGWARV